MVMQRGTQTYEYEMQLAEGYDFVDPVLNVYLGDNDQWIIWTPQGYYDASPGADELIGWHINRGPQRSAIFFEVQQFRDQLYRPDIIDRILDGQRVSDAIRAANEARHIEVVHDFRSPSEIAEVFPPLVSIVSPTTDAEVSSTVTFRVRVESVNGLPIQEATLLHNGKVLKVFEPVDVRESVSVEVTHEVELEPGENQLAVLASNMSSRSEYVFINVQDSRKPPRETPGTDLPAAHVLVVGISQANSSNKNSGQDAEAFARLIQQQGQGRVFSNVNLRLLKEEHATRDNILDGFSMVGRSGQTTGRGPVVLRKPGIC